MSDVPDCEKCKIPMDEFRNEDGYLVFICSKCGLRYDES